MILVGNEEWTFCVGVFSPCFLDVVEHQPYSCSRAHILLELQNEQMHVTGLLNAD